MRPLELTLEGFKSYRKSQTFNFESRSLFGIVGPTGSGKSSILEGMIFGLYGKTPSVESGNKKLINSQEEQARVQLVFEVDDVAWEVVRLIRQKGTSQTVLRRIDGVGEPVVGERAVTERIEEIVGLDFESFRSSVSLPQGEFDRFLKATPTERSRILKGIFRLERVDLLREAAKSRWQKIEAQIYVLKSTLDAFPEHPELMLAELEGESVAAQQFLDLVREELPKVLQAEQDVRHSAQEISRVGLDLSQTETALRRLPPEEQLRNLADLHDGAEHRMQAAQSALTAAAQVLVDAESEESRVVTQTGGDAWLAAVEAALGSRGRLTVTLRTARQEHSQLEALFKAGAARLPTLEADFDAAESVLAGAKTTLRKLEQNHAAHLLRLDLAVGEPCPVCEHPVATVPTSATLPALSAAEDEVRTAEAGLKAARSAFESATTQNALAQERLKNALELVEQRRKEIDELEKQLAELAPVKDPALEVSIRRTALSDVRAALTAARARRDNADAEERKSRRELDALAQKTRDVVNLLSHTSGLLGIGSVAVEGQGLWDAAKRVFEAGAARVEALTGQIAGLRAAAQTAVRLVEEFRTRFKASPGDQASDVLAHARADVTRLELKIEDLKAGIEKRKETEVELATLVERRARFDRLIADFTDSKFTAFLLDEQRRLLSRIGSEKFLELTGHYTFDDAGQFQIVDQRTGVTRTPDTLSGGETFLASLALALALSEAVAMEGGRLGCFFLDEGFGSLDQESLDLALEGIETLTNDPGRLIGLISHVPGVQARLDDLIILERLADGSTEVAQHEGPIGYASALI